MFDKSQARRVARQIRGAKETEVAPERFRKPLGLVFGSAYRRAMPYAGVSTLLDMPYRPEAPDLPDFAGLDVALVGVPMDLGVTNRAGARLWAAGGARRRAHRPLQPCARRHPGRRMRRRRYRRRAVALALQPRRFDRGHRRVLRAHPGRRGAAGLGRRRPFGDLSDPEIARRRAAGRPRPYRRPLRHDGRGRRLEIPPWRPVPPGGAGRRARPRAHDPDRHPRPGRDLLGLFLRIAA